MKRGLDRGIVGAILVVAPPKAPTRGAPTTVFYEGPRETRGHLKGDKFLFRPVVIHATHNAGVMRGMKATAGRIVWLASRFGEFEIEPGAAVS
jgi:hypothetical protein